MNIFKIPGINVWVNIDKVEIPDKRSYIYIGIFKIHSKNIRVFIEILKSPIKIQKSYDFL